MLHGGDGPAELDRGLEGPAAPLSREAHVRVAHCQPVLVEGERGVGVGQVLQDRSRPLE